MKKPMLLAAVTMLSFTVLAGCSASDADKGVVIKSDKGEITKADVYTTLISNEDNKAVITKDVVQSLFLDEYGDKITNKQVNKQLLAFTGADSLETLKKDLSDSKVKELKEEVKKQLAYEYGVKHSIKVTDEEMKEEFKSFQPDRKVYMLQSSDLDEMNKAQEELKARVSFENVVKNHTSGTKQEHKVSNIDTSQYPQNVIDKVFSAKKDDTTELISYKTGDYQFYFMAKITDDNPKSDDWKDYKKELKKRIIERKSTEEEVINQIVRQKLSKHNVRVLDKNLKTIFDEFK